MANEKTLPGRIVVLAFGGLLIIALIGTYMIQRANRSKLALPTLGDVPQFTFTERSGEPFGRKDLMGKITVMDFIFTRCIGVCPVMADRIGDLYKRFESYPDVQFVSVSVDPDYDSLSVLQRYATDHGVTDNRWLFLRAPQDSVIALAEGGLKLPMSDLPQGHSSKFVLIDNNAEIRGYYASDDDQSQLLLQQHMRALAGAMK